LSQKDGRYPVDVRDIRQQEASCWRIFFDEICRSVGRITLAAVLLRIFDGEPAGAQTGSS